MTPMSNAVKVWRNLEGVTIEINNFIFEVKVILGSGKYYSGRTDGEAGNRTSYNPVGAGTGAALGNIYYEYTKTIYSYR